MELALKHNLNVNLGDVIYYVNNGTKSSQGDVQKVNKPKKGWSETQIDLFYSVNKNHKEKAKYLQQNGWEMSWGDDNWVRSDAANKEANTGIPTDVAYRLAMANKTDSVIQLNCYMLDQKDIENTPDLLGDYNVPRAITTFNKRIEPLLVVFKQEIRDSLLIDEPNERGFYTKDQCELVNGKPFSSEDQDTIEDLATITEDEMNYWHKRGLNHDYMYKLAEDGWEEKLIQF
jgi:hypothetical protein